jgi:hypothetical protein
MEAWKILIFVGFSIVTLGMAVWIFQRAPWVYSWFGSLPGDIKHEGERTTFYAPIVSMLVLSLVFNVLWRISNFLAGRLFR